MSGFDMWLTSILEGLEGSGYDSYIFLLTTTDDERHGLYAERYTLTMILAKFYNAPVA